MKGCVEVAIKTQGIGADKVFMRKSSALLFNACFFLSLIVLGVSRAPAANDLDSVMISAWGAQALPQICPIMVVGKIEEEKTVEASRLVKVKIIESIWGHLKKNHKVKALWLPARRVASGKSAVAGVSSQEIVLGLFPSEEKDEYEFVIKPLCRYLATSETVSRLNCLRDKRCREFLPGRLVIP